MAGTGNCLPAVKTSGTGGFGRRRLRIAGPTRSPYAPFGEPGVRIGVSVFGARDQVVSRAVETDAVIGDDRTVDRRASAEAQIVVGHHRILRQGRYGHGRLDDALDIRIAGRRGRRSDDDLGRTDRRRRDRQSV